MLPIKLPRVTTLITEPCGRPNILSKQNQRTKLYMIILDKKNIGKYLARFWNYKFIRGEVNKQDRTIGIAA